MAGKPANHHATMIVLGDRGILISGASGSGKSQLALHLIDGPARFGRLVADDQVFLRARGGRLVASAPPATAGLIEARGFGPAQIPAIDAAVVDLLVLLEGDASPRMADDERHTIGGVALPMLRLGMRDAHASAYAVRAWLGLLPFPL